MKVVFIEGTKEISEPKSKTISVGWWLIWVLAAALFIMFVLRPDWFVVPEW